MLVPDRGAGRRLDAGLAEAQPEHSRSRWQALIRQGQVQVDGQTVRKPNHSLREGQHITWDIPPPEPVDLVPEAMDLDILHEDADLIAINKPPGLVVHPAAGHSRGTLVHALLHHCPDLAGIGGEIRPGIVHRLDKDTSGVLVVAKNETALRALQEAFKTRAVQKTYQAIVRGCPKTPSGTIDTLIGRHPRHRQKMATHTERGRRAISHFHTLETWPGAARLSVVIETGRTHQIRVHLAHIGCPILGDRIYGVAGGGPLPTPPRQMLHAEELQCPHPGTGATMVFHAPLPDDMQSCRDQLSGGTSDPAGA